MQVAHAKPHALVVRPAPGMGRGVFAGRPYRSGAVIEVCPILLLDGVTDEETLVGGLKRYVFKWGRDEEHLAIALGYGSLYNHSRTPNARFALRVGRNEIVFRAIRDVAPGEQILVDYGWDEAGYAAFS